MHNYFMSIILNHSIVLAAIIGAARFKYVIPAFYPFICIIWIGLINESLSLFMIHYQGANTFNSNLFVLLEYLAILFQFFKWNDQNSRKYYLLAGLGLAVWIADNLMINSPTQNNSLFRLFYSLVILFFSIDQVNKIINYERGSLLKNAMFIICFAFLFYYGFKAFIESFNAFHIGLRYIFLRNLWIILYFVNFISNLLYAVAILCMPTKQEFTMPY